MSPTIEMATGRKPTLPPHLSAKLIANTTTAVRFAAMWKTPTRHTRASEIDRKSMNPGTAAMSAATTPPPMQ
jgi:hypothetical protein